MVSEKLNQAIASHHHYLLSQQYSEGYWWAELESNITLTAEVLLLHFIWGTEKTLPFDKIEKELRSQQQDSGGWGIFYQDGGEISTSVEAYMALRLLGVPKTDPALQKAKDFILTQGGISKSRVFTKFHLALIGCYDWRGLPSLPPWVMLLPPEFGVLGEVRFSIYEMSSWARSSTVPLIVVFDKKPVFPISSPIRLDELYSEGIENVRYEFPIQNDWTDLFLQLDKGFKWGELLNWVPFREEGLKAAVAWILQHQEPAGDWGGIIPAMVNSLLALYCLNYDSADPIIQRGFAAIERFTIETEDRYRVQACVSPVWDTAWVVRSLVESGLAPDHPAVVKGAQWLLSQQVFKNGDWAVKNKDGKPGSWAFEFENQFYPDLDDSAVVVMALNQVKLPDEASKQAAIERCVNWMMTMQCQPGGWAAFDIDNDQDWLNALPYADLKAMIDPNTADVTARVLEMVGELEQFSTGQDWQQKLQSFQDRINRAIAYLKQEQEVDGSWFGRWGVNYIYGTSGVLSALSLLSPKHHQLTLQRGMNWLIRCQNPDGGWGETCDSYKDPNLKGKGVSTASQTAWALLGLMAGGEATGEFPQDAVENGIQYLLSTQLPNGSWEEHEFTGTGFPQHFYIRYHFYCQYFPLLALGRYQQIQAKG